MNQHRTRHRRPRNRSALVGLSIFASAQDRLNERAPHVRRCAWPQCDANMDRPSFNPASPGERVDDRYGVLCSTHAVDVATAVIQHQARLAQVQRFFETQTTEQAVLGAEWRAEAARREAEKAALRGDREGFVYYLRVGERIKVGYSVDVKRRMRAYPPGSQLLAVEPGDRALERQRHHQFAGSRTDGREWFRPTPDLLELVAEIVEVHGEPKRFAHHYRKTEQPMRITRSA